MLPAIISILFISVHEQRRYHPSQGTLCQKKVFVERTILIASAPLIYKLCISLFLSKQPSNLSRNRWIIYIAPGMVAAAVRPAMTGEGKTQQKYRNFKLCPSLQLLTESTEEHCQTLQNFMNMQYPVNLILALYATLFIENPRLEKLVEQLTKYLSIKEWQKMNPYQLELQITLNTISLHIQQKRKSREIEEKIGEEIEKYTNITMPMFKQSLQEKSCPLVHSELIINLSDKDYNLAKQYMERALPSFTLPIILQESRTIMNTLTTKFKINVQELKCKYLPSKSQEMTYEKFLSLSPSEQLMQLLALESHLDSMKNNQDQQKDLWQNCCPKLRHQLLFLPFSRLSKNPDWLKLSDTELFTGAVNQELMLLLKHYTSEQLSLLIALETDDRINRNFLIKWMYYNAIDPKHPLMGALTINLVKDLANPDGPTDGFSEDVIELVKTQQAESLIQEGEFWKHLPRMIYNDMKAKIGEEAFQEFIQRLPLDIRQQLSAKCC